MRPKYAMLLVCLMLVAGTAAYSMWAMDPIRQYRWADGSIHFPTGKVDGVLFSYLQSGPAWNGTLERWSLLSDARGTGRWGSVYAFVDYIGLPPTPHITRPDLDPAPLIQYLSEGIRWMGDALSHTLGYVVSLDWLVGTASAACGDGASTCTWDNGGGDGLWNTATNWSNDTKPAAGDSVLFDATSNTAASVNEASAALTAFTVTTGYSSTITVNAAQTATWGTVSFTGTTTGTINTNGFAATFGSLTMAVGTLTLGASTITINGTWNRTAGTFNYNTSTLKFSSSGTLTNVAANTSYYNLTIDAGVIVTLGSRGGPAGVITVNGTLAFNGQFLDFLNGQTNPITFGGAGALSGSGIMSWFTNVNTTTVNIPARTDYPSWNLSPGGGATGIVWLLAAGTTTITGLTISASGGELQTNGNTFTVSANGLGTVGSPNSGIDFGSSVISFTGTFNIGSANVYIKFGTSTVTIKTNTYTNSSTNATWDAGTASVTMKFESSGSPRNYTFGGTNLNESEFYNLTFDAGFAGAGTFTMVTRGLIVGNNVSITPTVGTNILDTASLALTIPGTLTISNGATLTANASSVTVGAVTMTGGTSGTITITTGAWTVSGSWNTSGAGSTFSEGTTSTYAFSAAGTITLLSTDNTFTTATVSAGTVTLGSALIIDRVLTISGGTLAKTTQTLTITNSQGATNALTMSGGDLTSTSGAVSITGAVNISSASSAITFGSEAWTITGAWTDASTDSAVWDAGSGTVTFTSAIGATMTFGGANLNDIEFNNVTFTSSAGTSQTFTMATRGLIWSGTLTVTDGSGGTILDKATLTLTGGALTISGAAASGLTSTSGAVSVTNVTVSTATAYIDLGSEAWTLTGTWSNVSTNASWDAGSGTVTFLSLTGGTMTFDDPALGENELNNVTFTSSAVTPQTFTMATQGLRWSGLLTVVDGGSTTTLDTGGFSLSNFTLTAAITVGAGGILTANASTITIAGNFDFRSGTFNQGTSTVNIAGSATVVASDGSRTVNNFYDLIIGIGATVTANTQAGTGGTWSISHTLTINGTIGITPDPSAFTIFITGTQTNPLLLGGAAAFNDTAFQIAMVFYMGANFNLPASTTLYRAVVIDSSVGTITTSMQGNTTIRTLSLNTGGPVAATTVIFDTTANNYNLTISSVALVVGNTGPDRHAAVLWRNGTHSVAGNLVVNTTSSYMTFGSASLSIGDYYINASTSASWNAGTGSVTFTSNANVNMTFAGTNLAVDEFYTLTFRSSAAGAVTFTMITRGLRVGAGGLTVVDAAGSTTLSTGANLGMDLNGNLTVDVGGILTLNASAVTCSGNVDINGTLNAGTSTFTLDGTNQTITAGSATFATVVMSTLGSTKTWGESFGIGSATVDSGVIWTISDGVTMTVTAGSTITMRGTLDWNGDNGIIRLRSTGVSWRLNATTGQQVYYVDSAQSDASGGGLIEDCVGGVDSGGNVNWIFYIEKACGGFATGPIEKPGATGFSCTQIFLRAVCHDDTQYTGREIILRVDWYVDGAYVTSTGPGEWIVLPVGTNFLDWADGSSRVTMQILFATQFPGGPLVERQIALNNWTKPLFALIGLLLFVYAAHGISASTLTRRVRPRNPSYRNTAILVEEYPHGWRSYRQRAPERYDRFVSKTMKVGGRKVWVVYGIREATLAEQRRTGRGTIAEVQTVRERVAR